MIVAEFSYFPCLNFLSSCSIKDYENRHLKNNRATGDPQQIVKSATAVSETSKSSSTKNVETNSINSATTPRDSPDSPAIT